ncbi:MAG TPA: hypothetical protein VFM53_12650 [Anaeromyxobacteraceae bacterium]|nr:hypothetical protein [Anaeromyxobacteraceae bacterium]
MPDASSRPFADPRAEEEAWAGLRARWDDEPAHRAFLDRFADLPGLARAGARYRAVLEAEPGDAPALRGRDEVLRRATAMALAAAPRPAPRPDGAPGTRRWLFLAAGALLAVLAGAAALALLRSGAAG